MLTLSDIVIRVNKEEKIKINYEGKSFSIFEFIEKCFNNHFRSMKNKVKSRVDSAVFDGKEYFDYIMQDIYLDENDPFVEIISNIAYNSNVELCIFKIVEDEEVFHAGDIDNMGLNDYVRKNYFKDIFIPLIYNITTAKIKKCSFLDNIIFSKEFDIIKNKIYSCIKDLNNYLSNIKDKEEKTKIYENTKYSLINLMSKYSEIEEFYNSNLNFSIDLDSGCFSLDICEQPLESDYSVNLNVKFLSNGNVCFALHDGDKKDDSYLSNYKFKSTLNQYCYLLNKDLKK